MEGHCTRSYPVLEKDAARAVNARQDVPLYLIPNRVDITERPEVVDLRSRLGDWEGDTVFGQNAHLVTLVDRKSRFTLIDKVDNKQAETVADSMIKLLGRVSSVCTITLDNGGEFAAHERVAKTVNADVFFAKPYASHQRGTNENTNGIIRRTWPKKMALGDLSEAEIRETELLINTMPRKVLGGRTPLEAYTGESLQCTYYLNPALLTI